MSLDIWLVRTGKYDDNGETFEDQVYSANITHNLNTMADAAGFYRELWSPEEVGIETADQLAAVLSLAIFKMRADPEHFKQFDSPNGWGTYKDFVPWLERLLEACVEHPTAKIRISR